MNTLYYGDNLPILRQHIPTESVDLIYLDPPFNSARNYNVLFKDSAGRHADAQITAFADTWTWGDTAAATYDELISQPTPAGRAIAAIRDLIGENAMLAYLCMMTARLLELHRVLKPTGSLYLHCDPTASHYLKIILDAIFGVRNFRNEITWKRTSSHNDTSQGKVLHMGRIHDIILFYTKSEDATRNEVYLPYDQSYIDNFYRHIEEGTGRKYTLGDTSGPGGSSKGNPYYEFLGITRYWRYSKEKMQELYEQGRILQAKPGAVPRYKRYLDEMPGVPLQDVWDDIQPLGAHEKERLGYPTQKPLSLLERIIQASSNPGDVVLDPFCGCGTAVAAAQRLDRQWIGIDITHLAIALQKFRLADMFGLQPGRDYRVLGEPQDLASAQQLATEDRYQFQWWALSLLEARPYGATSDSSKGKKGSDKGIDGTLVIIDENRRPQSILIQVKSGHVKSGDIRDLVGTLEREKAPMGLFVTLEAPTQPMLAEAASAGLIETPWGKFPRLQIATIADLLAGRLPKLPPRQRQFKAAPSTPDSTQRPLDL